jgi:RimJ/RimL family protein N-acetyltransferase
LNPHALAGTSPSSWRVYLFRHSDVGAGTSGTGREHSPAGELAERYLLGVALPAARRTRIALRPLDLVTARAVLDGRRSADWSPGYPTAGDRDISRFLTDRPPPPGAPEVFGPYQIVVSASGTVVGGIGCHRPPDDSGSVEIGYGIAPEWRNQGLTTEAVGLLVERLASAGVSTVTARTAPTNLASQTVLRRNGFDEGALGNDGFVLWTLVLGPTALGQLQT